MKITLTTAQGVVGEFEIPTDDGAATLWKNLEKYLKSNKTKLLKERELALHQFIIDRYCQWMESRGTAGRITVADAKQVKDAAKYLLDICNGDERRAKNGWEVILSSYEYWSDFQKRNINLRQICADLVNIINNVKQRRPAGHSLQELTRFAH